MCLVVPSSYQPTCGISACPGVTFPMSVAPGGSVVLASYVKVEKNSQEMRGGY